MSLEIALGPKPIVWSKEACQDWIDRYNGVPHGGKIGSALKPLVARLGWSRVRPAWQKYLREVDPQFSSPAGFAAKFGLYDSKPKPEPTDEATAWLATYGRTASGLAVELRDYLRTGVRVGETQGIAARRWYDSKGLPEVVAQRVMWEHRRLA